MKKQKAHVNYIPRPNHAGGYIEWHRLERGNWILRDSINIPTNDLFDERIKYMVSKGLANNDKEDGKIIVYNANHSEGVISVTMCAKKAYEIFNQVVN